LKHQILLFYRYLWPLIHYHKFLAKCIKKLKRNGVDVKTSVSPVAVFLREEVCAVSDHLASVSLFDSDEWMECLHHFKGWTESDGEAQKHSRELVANIKLRPLYEPGDVDSPLLRSQIDEQYLRAIASAKAQLIGTDTPQDEKRPTSKVPPIRRRDAQQQSQTKTKPGSGSGIPQHPRLHKNFHPSAASPGMLPLHHQWQGYNGHPWWQNGWHHAPYPYTDDASVQSALSGDTSYTYMNGYHHPGAMHHPQQYYHPMMYPHHLMHGVQSPYDLAAIPGTSIYSPPSLYPGQMPNGGWMGQPQMVHPSMADSTAVPATPSRTSLANENETAQTAEEQSDPHNTPYKYTPSHAAMSPYWAHLQDHATLSMMGLSTPQGPSAPATPHHPGRNSELNTNAEESSEDDSNPQNALNAQPLLLRQQYYGYGVSSSKTLLFSHIVPMIYCISYPEFFFAISLSSMAMEKSPLPLRLSS
jgi:hypothetical protein